MTSVELVSEEKHNQEQAKEEGGQSPRKRVKLSEAMRAFKEAFDHQENGEERLKMSIAFMKQALSQEKTPRFKDFWEAKKLCLELFKEKINPLLKAECWNEYTTLSAEAKRLKDLLEEQSAFAVEQIELALQALEADLKRAQEVIQKLPSLEKGHDSTFLADKWSMYDQKQREIQFYITLAGRMRDLRKEVIETEMRVKHKNRLLKRLSDLGTQFLPIKKRETKLVAQEFLQDVERFVSFCFDLERHSVKQTAFSPHLLRESIKEFQLLAKKIALHARAFTETRTQLSQCWEVLKEAEKEKKKEFVERQEQFQVEHKEAVALIAACSTELKEQPPTTKEQLHERIHYVMKELEKKNLSGADFKVLRAQLRRVQEEALAPFLSQERQYILQREREDAQRKEKLETFKTQLQQVLSDLSKSSLKTLQELEASFDERVQILRPDTREMQKLQEAKKELYEALLLKKEEELTEEDAEGLEALLREWEAFREVTRTALERYRKEMGNSGFDFEKAMLFSKQMDLEKSRLDRAAEKIVDLEDKLG